MLSGVTAIVNILYVLYTAAQSLNAKEQCKPQENPICSPSLQYFVLTPFTLL